MKYMMILNGCGESLKTQSEEMAAFLERSRLLPADGHAVILYTDEQVVTAQLAYAPVQQVTLLRLVRYQPENALAALTDLLTEPPALLLFSGDYAGRELSVRLACRLGGSSLIGVTGMTAQREAFLCTKNAYANNMTAEIRLSALPACLSISRGARVPITERAGGKQITERRDHTALEQDRFVLKRHFTADQPGGGLADADFVLAAGRGVSTKQEIEWLAETAETLHAGFGVSRPPAMNAHATLDQLIGVSGRMLSPKLCIAVGVSGAGAFLAGVEASECLIAVNTDENAAMMKAADAAVVADYREFIPALLGVIQENGGGHDD